MSQQDVLRAPLSSVDELLSQAQMTPEIMGNIVKQFLKSYHPDRNPESEQYTKEARKHGADYVLQVLSSLAKDAELDRWDSMDEQMRGRNVFFPKKGAMTESLVVTVGTPREFLMLLSKYGDEKGLSGDSLANCKEVAIAAAEEAESFDDNDVEESIDYTEEVGEILGSLNENVTTLAEYADWFEQNQDDFRTALLSFPVVIDGNPTNLRAALNSRAIELIRTEAESATLDSFNDFSQEVKTTKFFVTAKTPVPLTMGEQQIAEVLKEYVDPSRAEANRLLKETLVSLFERAIESAAREELPIILARTQEYTYEKSVSPVYLTRRDIADLHALEKARKKAL